MSYKDIFNKSVLLPLIGLSIANTSVFASDDVNKSLNLSVPNIVDACNSYIVSFDKECKNSDLDLGSNRKRQDNNNLTIEEQKFQELSSLEMSKTITNIAVDKAASNLEMNNLNFLDNMGLPDNLFSKAVYKLIKNQAETLVEKVHSKYTGEEITQNEEDKIGFKVDFKF